jgi:hypothetical protein
MPMPSSRMCLPLAAALCLASGCARSIADRGTGWWRVTGEHVVLETDLDRERAVTAGWALEDLHRAVEAALPVCAGAEIPPMHVTMIARGDEYEALASGRAAYFGARPGIVGHSPVLVSRAGSHAEPAFAHQLVHRIIAACHPTAPPWVTEGLARYLETIEIGGDELVVGISAFHISGGGPITTVFHSGRAVVPQVPVQLVLSPTALAVLGEPEFYADPNEAHAASAWVLVHMLELGPSQDLRDRFQTYLSGLAENGGNQTLYFTSSFPPEVIEPAANAYLQALRRERHVPYAPGPLADPRAEPMSPSEAHLVLARVGARRSTAYDDVRAHLALAMLDPATEARARLAALEIGAYDRWQSKADYFRVILTDHPDDLDVLAAAAQLELSRGRPTNEGRRILGRLAAHDDLRASDLSRLAVLAGLHHLRDDALRYAEAAVRADTTDSLAHTTLSYALAVRGDRDGAGRETRIAWMMANHAAPPWLWGADDGGAAREAAIAATDLPPEPVTPGAPFTRASVPLGCDLDDPAFGALTVGSAVVLGRHEAWRGTGDDASTEAIVTEDWVGEMDPFVGRSAHVTALVGLDPAGCPVVHVDADDSTWLWRVRDLQPPP